MELNYLQNVDATIRITLTISGIFTYIHECNTKENEQIVLDWTASAFSHLLEKLLIPIC